MVASFLGRSVWRFTTLMAHQYRFDPYWLLMGIIDKLARSVI
jgi:hypothetical protein